MLVPFEAMLFYSISTLLVLSAMMVVTRKNPVASAVYLVVSLFLVAALYALLGADFAAAIQVLVYAGAIMVLFVFVIMLLNVDPDERGSPRLLGVPEILALIVSLVGFVAMAVAGAIHLAPDKLDGFFTPANVQQFGGNTLVIGWTFLVRYLWPFEMSSFLILLAIVASILIAKKPKIAGQISKKEF